MAKNEVATELRSIGLFEACSDDEIAEIARVSDVLVVESGHELFRQGDTATSCFVIVDGEAVLRIDGRGAAVLGPGDTVGEMALIEQESRMGTVVTTVATRCIEIDGEGFQTLLRRMPGLSNSLLIAISRRLRALQLAKPVWV